MRKSSTSRVIEKEGDISKTKIKIKCCKGSSQLKYNQLAKSKKKTKSFVRKSSALK